MSRISDNLGGRYVPKFSEWGSDLSPVCRDGLFLKINSASTYENSVTQCGPSYSAVSDYQIIRVSHNQYEFQASFQ